MDIEHELEMHHPLQRLHAGPFDGLAAIDLEQRRAIARSDILRRLEPAAGKREVCHAGALIGQEREKCRLNGFATHDPRTSANAPDSTSRICGATSASAARR